MEINHVSQNVIILENNIELNLNVIAYLVFILVYGENGIYIAIQDTAKHRLVKQNSGLIIHKSYFSLLRVITITQPICHDKKHLNRFSVSFFAR